MATDIPKFVTHDHLAERLPFLNLSDLDEDSLLTVTQELTDVTGSQRRFGRNHMALRRATEAKMRELFIAAGGQPDDWLRTTSS